MNNKHDLKFDFLYQQAAKLIHNAEHVVITAGAGMSVDSGMPDFRGEEGFYKAYPAFKYAKLSFYDVANPSLLFQNPTQYWWFYGHRFELYKQTKPHHGYQIIKEWLDKKDGFVFTSNVDGHFQKSGISPSRMVECHGSINLLQCSVNCSSELYRIERLPFSTQAEPFVIKGSLPRCRHCGEYARPNILMFSDTHWNAELTNLQTDRFYSWQYAIEKLGTRIVVVEIGAGQTIPTIKLQSEFMGCPIIRINPNIGDAKVNDGISLPVGALEALTKINECLTELT